MFKDEYKKKYDSISPDPAFRLRLEERIEDMRSKRKHGMMRRTAVIALAAMLVLSTVGLASGAFRSVFTEVMGMFAREASVDYEHMAQNAETNVGSQIVMFESGAYAEVKLEQSYYNGQQLALGWSVAADSAEAEFLEREDERAAAAEESVLSVDLREKIGSENAAEFEKRYASEGWAGVAWYECYLGDQTYLAGFDKVTGEDGHEHAPEEALLIPETDCDWLGDGAMLGYDEFETPLPEAAQDQESLKIARKLNCQQCWLIADEGRIYTGRGEAEWIELTFEVARSEAYDEASYAVEAQFPSHAAEIELTRTPIRAEFKVVNQVSDEWKSIWSDYSGYLHAPLNLAEDVVFDYEILVDGSEVSFETGTYGGVEGVGGWFMLPADAEQVTFRPVYANTGAHPDEDVVINMK